MRYQLGEFSNEPAISTADFDEQEARQGPVRRPRPGLRARGRAGPGRAERPHAGPHRPSRRRPRRWVTATTAPAPRELCPIGVPGRRSEHRGVRRLPRAGTLAGGREDRQGARLPRLRPRLQRLHRQQRRPDRPGHRPDLGRLRGLQGLGRGHDLRAGPRPGRRVHRRRASSSTRRPATSFGSSDKTGRYLEVAPGGLADALRGPPGQCRTRSTSSGNTPKLPRETGVCLSSRPPDLGACAFAPGPRAQEEARASFDAARAAGVGVVDALKWFCSDGVCPSVVGNYITMRDSEHMTPDYARWLARPLEAELGLAGPVRSG